MLLQKIRLQRLYLHSADFKSDARNSLTAFSTSESVLVISATLQRLALRGVRSDIYLSI